MRFDFTLPKQVFEILGENVKKTLLKYLADNCGQILKDKIRVVYEINSQIRTNENYVPLEEMLSAVVVDIDYKTLKMFIFIDEDQISWKDKYGESIHEVSEPYGVASLHKGFSDNGIVADLEHHWKTPIENRYEDDYFFDEAFNEIADFISTKFSAEVKKHITKR